MKQTTNINFLVNRNQHLNSLSISGNLCARDVCTGIIAASTMLLMGCRPQPTTNATVPASVPVSVPAQTTQNIASSQGTTNTSGTDAPGEWGAFNTVLRSGGIFKNASGKYFKLTFAPLGDSMDAIFTDAPSGKVTVTNAKGNRSQGSYSLERDRTLTITILSSKTKKIVYELSRDGHKLSPINGGETLFLQP